MKSVKVKLGNEELVLKRSFRGLVEFERFTKRSISDVQNNVTDKLIMIYCMLRSANKSWEVSFDDFCDLMDDNTDVISGYEQIVTDDAGDTEKKSEQNK